MEHTKVIQFERNIVFGSVVVMILASLPTAFRGIEFVFMFAEVTFLVALTSLFETYRTGSSRLITMNVKITVAAVFFVLDFHFFLWRCVHQVQHSMFASE